MSDSTDPADRLAGISVVPEPSKARLNERQLIDYRAQREQCLDWLLALGKHPGRAEGYAFSTVKNRSHRMDAFYRWVWTQENGYTADVTHDHADEWLRDLAHGQTSNAHKSNCKKAVMMLFSWRHHEHGLDEWEPKLTFSSPNQSTTPRDYLTRDERRAIREAALEYGSVPDYDGLAPKERDRWKAYLAQKLEKPKSKVKPADWDLADGWKIPSLTWVSLDAGLRPIEVKRSTIDWVDIDNSVLRIPKEDSAKNRAHWVVSLQDRTADMLDRWLKQRDAIPKYDDSDALWLTREANPYQSHSLKYILNKLCDVAEIETEHRSMTWYAVRHSVGTYMTREEDLAAAQTQLRHKTPETTMKYDQVPVEDRQDALDRMG